MYQRILKKDLKRKKTMNVILLMFIILAATFIASSANNLVSVSTALDTFFDKAGVPDYWVCLSGNQAIERFESFAKKYKYDFKRESILSVDKKDVKVNDKEFEYSAQLRVSSLKNSTKVFDKDDREITEVKDGEVYLTGTAFYSSQNDIHKGDIMKITIDGRTKSFTVKGNMKDAMFGSSMIGMTRFLVSENDFQYFYTENATNLESIYVYTDDSSFVDRFNKLDLNAIFFEERSQVKMMYIMNMILAAIMLVVSICLILISMVILRFTINFTMSEEFREIGVMKAIGITNQKIRTLYIIKYFAISAVAGMIGFVFSMPFGKMMLKNVSRDIVLSGDGSVLLNLLCAFMVVVVVVLYCYFCTRKIKRFSPIDAIRNGENGERYSRKGFLHLSRSRVSPIPFMAVNDILSGLRRFVTMILIFILGMLLIIIPINVINTLQSEHLATWFSMAECDHVISKELLVEPNADNKKRLKEEMDDIKTLLSDKGIQADVFQEVVFRMYITYKGNKMSSLAFQGAGDVTADMYTYLEGTAPQNNDEVGISHMVADKIGAGIGDTVSIKSGDTTKNYIVTALFQTMNNMGEGIRFYEKEQLDYGQLMGTFGMQISYQDSPDGKELERRKEILRKHCTENDVYTLGEYVNVQLGQIAEQLHGIRDLILIVVLCINILVTVLMVKSFIAKEKGEIAILKAMGFEDSSLAVWQALRIGIVLFISVIAATLLSTPLTKLSAEPIFRMMGALSIQFKIVPLEVYVIYPLIVLCVTVCAAILAAQQVRRISSSEAANVE